jgi:NADPH-dependent glutamate synthase beta subunit-like oxidoreductase/dihydroorotate dehydrogenase/ferredoxin
MLLTDAQLQAEIKRCEFCEEKPCKTACPAGCSPADFLMAARQGRPSDYARAAALILSKNPLGGICGAVCPDYHCMKGCSRNGFDTPVNIPAAQSTIIAKARELGVLPSFTSKPSNGFRIAILGAGPAGLGAAAWLAQAGYKVELYDAISGAGGTARYIPSSRLDATVLDADVQWVLQSGSIRLHPPEEIEKPCQLLECHDAVIVATGQRKPLRLTFPGAELATDWKQFLADDTSCQDARVAVIGGGAVAVDCALVARNRGAATVSVIMLENLGEMQLTARERAEMVELNLTPLCRTSVTHIEQTNTGLLLQGQSMHCTATAFAPAAMQPVEGTEHLLGQFDTVIFAIGSRSDTPIKEASRLFYAGDLSIGASTVVEAVASGKQAAVQCDAVLQRLEKPQFENPRHCEAALAGLPLRPVALDTEFFGFPLKSPFLLSAAPPSDGYEQMKKALDAGWAGGVMKTAFDDLPIHIPAAYMYKLNEDTYGNCDNVSGHPLRRVAAEASRLAAEYPDRLIMVSTGGPVTGNDEADKAVWQSNTRILEEAGVRGVEYSLSCPQGGDGTEGDIVSQNAALTAKIVDWVMQRSNPDIPKLFKLTGAVTSIVPILQAIKEVFQRYPDKKAGVTLANTFPALAFRPGEKTTWDEGVVIGMSGDGVKHISNLTLANAAQVGLTVSGNGGPMDYKAAADFLALGADTVQFCTAPTKYGIEYISELEMGLSYYMDARGIASVAELIGCALPQPITDFMDLSPVKQISDVNPELCMHCGNCTRCPYLAISLNEELIPITDPSRCVGCSICVQKCFAGALFMRDRSAEEAAQLKED